ncbi:hypothetical protein R3P38DRAFT_3043413 [Favolaschia claudopus]|uniref:Uncharacterized protein n=1 Tax=Favolaschia claudopus TaxID=2862362 RepID=A0AAW0A6U5_9AGAR
MNLILVLAPIFLVLFTRASALLIPRADINGTLNLSPSLQKCGSDLKCRCTDANANNFANCVDCILGFNSGSLAQNAAQSVLDGQLYFLNTSMNAGRIISQFPL